MKRIRERVSNEREKQAEVLVSARCLPVIIGLHALIIFTVTRAGSLIFATFFSPDAAE